MSPTKYDFMQDMLIRARNRHRRELGLCPESPEVGPCSPEPGSSTGAQAEGLFSKLCEKDKNNPIPLEGE